MQHSISPDAFTGDSYSVATVQYPCVSNFAVWSKHSRGDTSDSFAGDTDSISSVQHSCDSGVAVGSQSSGHSGPQVQDADDLVDNTDTESSVFDTESSYTSECGNFPAMSFGLGGFDCELEFAAIG